MFKFQLTTKMILIIMKQVHIIKITKSPIKYCTTQFLNEEPPHLLSLVGRGGGGDWKLSDGLFSYVIRIE